MQLTTLLAGSIAMLSAFSSAQQFPKRSGPFHLVLQAHNRSVDGMRLSACHTGAAIESLCLHVAPPESDAVKFYYNYTTSGNTPTKNGVSNNGVSNNGILTWNLQTGDGLLISEPLTFTYNPGSNMAIPVFTPGDGSNEVSITIDENDYLYVLTYLDDSISPPVYRTQRRDRWQICRTNFSGYTYTTLSWTLGWDRPQNPSCQSVHLRREPIRV